MAVQHRAARRRQRPGHRQTIFGTLDADGAKKVARDFAADILQQFGAKSLAGTKIYFVSDRSGTKEIWSMDYDGSHQQRLTQYKSTSSMPAVSPDGKMFAFTPTPEVTRRSGSIPSKPDAA